MVGVFGGVVSVVLVLVEEALGGEEAIGDPRDSFDAEIGADNGQVGGEVPLVGGR